MSGKNGNSLFIKVPCGTVISEVMEDEIWDDDFVDSDELIGEEANTIEVREGEDLEASSISTEDEIEKNNINSEEEEKEVLNSETIAGDEDDGRRVELNYDGEMVMVAKGGNAGLGNLVTSSGKHRNKSIVSHTIIDPIDPYISLTSNTSSF